jgi:hypothetical protein
LGYDQVSESLEILKTVPKGKKPKLRTEWNISGENIINLCSNWGPGVIPATWEVEVGELWFEASLHKSTRPY